MSLWQLLQHCFLPNIDPTESLLEGADHTRGMNPQQSSSFHLASTLNTELRREKLADGASHE
eukprot:12305791-Ditylum_brightwellii.AAC.1